MQASKIPARLRTPAQEAQAAKEREAAHAASLDEQRRRDASFERNHRNCEAQRLAAQSWWW